MVVDADCIIRFLTLDDRKKAESFEKRLKSSKKLLVITDVTFAEVYWTLRSFYNFPKEKIIEALSALIDEKSIRCNSLTLKKTLETLRNINISFIDSYTASFSQIESDGRVLSFDKGFDKVPLIIREEP